VAGELTARDLAGVGDGLAEFVLDDARLRTVFLFREPLE
jgi:hypothetical protein